MIGQLYYKDCHALDQWKKGWFAMDKSSLRFCLQMQEVQEDRMHLRRLQELSKIFFFLSHLYFGHSSLSNMVMIAFT